jgi:hypothetical protein
VLGRRTFLASLAGALLALPFAALRRAGAATLSEGARRALASSPYVYVSPLRSSGEESGCHAEVWFGWLDGRVVVITGSTGWKARALGRGLDRARIWVGDHGRWKRIGITNDAFRKAPSFDARAAKVTDPALLDRLMAEFRRKYGAEFDEWEPKMRAGFADGSRTLIAYEPL